MVPSKKSGSTAGLAEMTIYVKRARREWSVHVRGNIVLHFERHTGPFHQAENEHRHNAQPRTGFGRHVCFPQARTLEPLVPVPRIMKQHQANQVNEGAIILIFLVRNFDND